MYLQLLGITQPQPDRAHFLMDGKSGSHWKAAHIMLITTLEQPPGWILANRLSFALWDPTVKAVKYLKRWVGNVL